MSIVHGVYKFSRFEKIHFRKLSLNPIINILFAALHIGKGLVAYFNERYISLMEKEILYALNYMYLAQEESFFRSPSLQTRFSICMSLIITRQNDKLCIYITLYQICFSHYFLE